MSSKPQDTCVGQDAQYNINNGIFFPFVCRLVSFFLMSNESYDTFDSSDYYIIGVLQLDHLLKCLLAVIAIIV